MKRFLWMVFAGSAVATAVFFVVSPRPGQVVEMVIAAALVAIWSARVALAMGRGEHLRRAWGLTAFSHTLMAVSIPLSSEEMPAAVLAFTLAINGFAVASIVYFARAYAVAGIDLAVSPAGKWTLYGTIFVVAVLIVAVPIVHTVHRIQAGDVRAALNLISSLGDLVTMTLLGPILLTALALRGGLLAWTWGLLAAANVAWLLCDAGDLIAFVAPGVGEDSILAWSNLWQVLACLWTFAAAEAQRRVSHGEASPT